MGSDKVSGQGKFVFAHRGDLNNLPSVAQEHEVRLHGGFAVDDREGCGEVYYGMPGCGIMRVDADLKKQSIINLPVEYAPLNFHSTKIGEFDGKHRLFLSAESNEKVIVMGLDGSIDFVLPRPVFDEYQKKDAPYKPTDTVLVDDQLYIADGYGSNYITSVDVKSRKWQGIFGGLTSDATEDGKFATAHGINFNPVHQHLDIADRPSSRIQAHAKDGRFIGSYKFPPGAWLCGMSYVNYQGRWLGVIG